MSLVALPCCRRLLTVGGLVLVALMLTTTVQAKDHQKRLRAALQDPRYKIRIQAASIIAKQRAAGARPLLEGLLDDPQPLVRAAACDALMALGDPAADRALRALLQDDSDIVRRRARLARRVLKQSSPGHGTGLTAASGGSPIRLATVHDRSNSGFSGLQEALRSGIQSQIHNQSTALSTLKRRYELMAQVEKVSVRNGRDQTRVDVRCQLTVAELPRRTLRLSTSVTAGAAIGGSADPDERDELAGDAARASGVELIREFVSWAVVQTGPAPER